MADDPSQRHSPDRDRINLSQQHEVRYWSQKFGVSEQELRDAVQELESIGTAVDGHVAVPARCPKCTEGEPELSQVDHRYELLCPECEHSSGTGNSRLAAVTRFMSATQTSTAT